MCEDPRGLERGRWPRDGRRSLMAFWDRSGVFLKTLLQLGVEGPALYGIYRLGLKTGHYRRLEDKLNRQMSAAAVTLRPTFDLPDRAQVSNALSDRDRVSLLKEANEIVHGKVRLFGSRPVALQLRLRGPLRHWTDYERHEAARPITRSIAAHSGDLKFLWEPARFGWAFSLGRAYHVTRREKFADAFWKYFEEFDKGNPPYMGPHWMNGQEVAIRLMALVWSAQVFAPAAASTPGRRGRLAQSVAQHARRLPATLVYARSQNNNHLVTESAALYTAGAALDNPSWRQLGWRWLNRALQRQISTYGEYIQHSSNYHRLMLHSVLWVDAIRRGRRENWPPATRDALMRASHWLFSMLDPASGHVPNLGANDGALILPLSSAQFDDFRPTVQAAARAFLRTSLPAGSWDELSVWLGLPSSVHTADSAAYAADHVRSRDSWAYLRASSFKSRLSHMDQLHLDLWWRGLNIARDAGTYLYNAKPPWDNPLVSTRVHNTITVDGQDQMTRGGRFLILDWFPAYSRHLLGAEAPAVGRMQASHDGYRRLGIRHERMASVTEYGRWEIIDDLIFKKSGQHEFRLHWLLMDDTWTIKESGGGVHLRLRTPSGSIRLDITGVNLVPPGPSVMLVRAGRLLYGRGKPLPYDGWYSPTYGEIVPALSLSVEASASRSCRFISAFVFSK